MESASVHLFECEERGGVTVVRVLASELREPAEAIDLGEGLTALLQAGGPRRLLLDFARVRYMGSTGYAALLVLAKKANRAGGRVELCGLQPDVRFGAEILGIGSILPIHDDEGAALAAP